MRIIQGGNQVFFYPWQRLGINAADTAIILDSKNNMTAVTVEKGADTFIHIPVDLGAAFFELNRQALATINNFV